MVEMELMLHSWMFLRLRTRLEASGTVVLPELKPTLKGGNFLFLFIFLWKYGYLASLSSCIQKLVLQPDKLKCFVYGFFEVMQAIWTEI